MAIVNIKSYLFIYLLITIQLFDHVLGVVLQTLSSLEKNEPMTLTLIV